MGLLGEGGRVQPRTQVPTVIYSHGVVQSLPRVLLVWGGEGKKEGGMYTFGSCSGVKLIRIDAAWRLGYTHR